VRRLKAAGSIRIVEAMKSVSTDNDRRPLARCALDRLSASNCGPRYRLVAPLRTSFVCAALVEATGAGRILMCKLHALAWLNTPDPFDIFRLEHVECTAIKPFSGGR